MCHSSHYPVDYTSANEIESTRSTDVTTFQTHPNIDKRGFQETGVVAMKQAGRPFPLNTDVGVLKWRFQSNDSEDLPLISKYFYR